MAKCRVRWRPSGGNSDSGGRGEYEYVPGNSLTDRTVTVRLPDFGVDIPAEVRGTNSSSQGKPRLRKFAANNRQKLHLVGLVMALARFPDPAREDNAVKSKSPWPLENKGFVVSEITFEIASDDGTTAVLIPERARILHLDEELDLTHRFSSLKADVDNISKIAIDHPALAEKIKAHHDLIMATVNNAEISRSAEAALKEQASEFGPSNAAPISVVTSLPPTDLEDDLKGKEGRILTRLHSFKERDKKFVKKAKELFRKKHGRLFCEACNVFPGDVYGPRGEDRMQAHHKTPVEELLPDSETKVQDLAMLCPNCHDIIHAKRPWITVEALQLLIHKAKSDKSELAAISSAAE